MAQEVNGKEGEGGWDGDAVKAKPFSLQTSRIIKVKNRAQRNAHYSKKGRGCS